MTVTRPVAALAAATATVLAATAFVTLPAVADDGSGGRATMDLTDGTLDWGVKESFRKYVGGPIGNGEITVADGAERNDDGTFRFTGGEGSYDTGSHGVEVAFEGSVHFTAHGGQLDIALDGLQLSTTDGRTGEITADVTAGGSTRDDVALADIDLSGVRPSTGPDGAMTFADIPATLTAEGATAFNGFYEKGEAMDPATLSVRPGDGGTGGPGGEAGGSGSSGSDSSGSDSSGSDSAGQSGAGGGDSSAGNGDAGASGSAGSAGSSGPGSAGTSGSGTPGGDSGEPGGRQPGTVVDGTLDWGVKESFRSYVNGPVGNGDVTLSGGAGKAGDGYRFPGGSGSHDAKSPALDAAFEGAVRFRAHKEAGEYALELKFSQLRVEADGKGGILVADVSSKDRETGDTRNYDDLAVATLRIPSGALTPEKDVITLSGVPATLTEKGAKAFGGFYQAGEALDPVTLAVSLDENAELPGGGPSGGDSGGTDGGDSGGTTAPSAATVGGPSGSLASTGGGVPVGGLVGGAAALATIGAAAAYATRRRTAES